MPEQELFTLHYIIYRYGFTLVFCNLHCIYRYGFTLVFCNLHCIYFTLVQYIVTCTVYIAPLRDKGSAEDYSYPYSYPSTEMEKNPSYVAMDTEQSLRPQGGRYSIHAQWLLHET